MKATIFPIKVAGKVVLPPSKSMSHRAIICASLANGKSTISNIAFSEDILTTIEGMKALGAKIECYDDFVEVIGIKNFENLATNDIECNESGSTLRFFVPIFSLTGQKINFLGKNRLLIRPQEIYREIFTSRGLEFSQDSEKLTICGKLPAGEYKLRGDVSSQFISGLLFTLPMLENDSKIIISEPYESRSYVDLTLQMMEEFGVKATYIDNNTLYIKGNQQYVSKNHTVEGDFSQFGFYGALGAINNTIDCLGLRHDSLQGDREMVSILRDFGVNVEEIEGGYRIHKADLKPVDINLENCPDLGPILSVLCANTLGNTKIYNAARLRIKESDRIQAMEDELFKFDVAISSTNDEVYIKGQSEFDTDVELSGHKDHRIVMALAILGTICQKEIVINQAEFIKKSYPHFFEDLAKLGVKVEKTYD